MPVSGKCAISFGDYDNEVTTTTVNVTALSAANYDAQATLRTAFQAALVAMTDGELQRMEYGNVSLQSISPASAAETEAAESHFGSLVERGGKVISWRGSLSGASTHSPSRNRCTVSLAS